MGAFLETGFKGQFEHLFLSPGPLKRESEGPWAHDAGLPSGVLDGPPLRFVGGPVSILRLFPLLLPGEGSRNPLSTKFYIM